MYHRKKKEYNMKQKYVNIQNKHTEIKEKCKYITELLHNDLIEIRWLPRLLVIHMYMHATAIFLLNHSNMG